MDAEIVVDKSGIEERHERLRKDRLISSGKNRQGFALIDLSSETNSERMRETHRECFLNSKFYIL